MIKSFRHKGLKELFLKGRSSKVLKNLQSRCLRRLDALDRATSVGDLDLPGFDFHALRGRPKRYSLHVNGPWCVTFEWAEGDSRRVDLEQAIPLRSEKMTDEYLVTKRPSRPPTHPGEILREDVLPSLKLSVSEAARRLRISRQTLHRIMAGTHPVRPDMAVRLGKFCGNGPRFWLAMQQEHDLWLAERQMADQVDAIETQSPV